MASNLYTEKFLARMGRNPVYLRVLGIFGSTYLIYSEWFSYCFRLDGNDKVKVNNSIFPHGPLPIISLVQPELISPPKGARKCLSPLNSFECFSDREHPATHPPIN